LERTARQIKIARIMLGDPKHTLYGAFLDLMEGSVLRQQGKLPDAVHLLSAALHQFVEMRHARYFLRARYELAKTFLNQGLFQEAGETLNRELPRFSANEDDHVIETRWKASDEQLRARIAYGRGLLAQAAQHAQRAVEILDAFPGRYSDLRALTLLVQAQIE